MTRLQLAEEDPRYASRGAASPAPRPFTPGAPQAYPGYPDATRHPSGSHHPRNASDPASYAYAPAPAPPHPHPQGMPAYPQGYPPQYAQHPRGPIPTGSYPYAGAHAMAHPGMASVPGPQHQPYHPDAGAGDRGSSSRYECSYCGKGFTRPSSLKVRALFHLPVCRAPLEPLRARAFGDLELTPSSVARAVTDTHQHSHGGKA